MRGGRQVGGPLLKRLMSRTAGLTLHWFAGVATHDATNNFKLYSRRFLEAVTDREHGRLRAGAGADGQGDARRPPRRRGADDLARPDRGPEQLQAPQVAAALPPLVLDGLPGPASREGGVTDMASSASPAGIADLRAAGGGSGRLAAARAGRHAGADRPRLAVDRCSPSRRTCRTRPSGSTTAGTSRRPSACSTPARRTCPSS